MLNRKAYNFYHSFYELAEDMTDEQRGQYYHAILQMQFDDVIEMPSDPLAKMAFKGQLYTLNQQLDGYKSKVQGSTPTEGGRQGGTEGGRQGPAVQEQEQVQGKEKEKGKEVVTLENRMVDFKNKIAPHINSDFDREDANDFFRYWTEMNEGGKKMRFEMQKVFDVKRRIITWKKNKHERFQKPAADQKVTVADFFRDTIRAEVPSNGIETREQKQLSK